MVALEDEEEREGGRGEGEGEEEEGEGGRGEVEEGEVERISTAGRGGRTKRKRIGVKRKRVKMQKRLERVMPGSEVIGHDQCEDKTAMPSGEHNDQNREAKASHWRKKTPQEKEGEAVKRRKTESCSAIEVNGLHGDRSSLPKKKRVSFSLHKNTIFTP